MTEVYHQSLVQEAEEEKITYWEQREQDALRALNYARRMLAQLAIEKSGKATE